MHLFIPDRTVVVIQSLYILQRCWYTNC